MDIFTPVSNRGEAIEAQAHSDPTSLASRLNHSASFPIHYNLDLFLEDGRT